ncbi:hypothetical protein Bsp3421_000100 (plasmid) [Burkholderia sp. FERM BP-3421]|uniref:hypothetical protein n=1 Tax=Burkholderia sp. FERM BP-3421 TaxID=1494466 RepID=UPI0023624A4B|nr:hypothetical protein [Burkholderia sp. FERM BP-3421]WDD90277.1 hypothetical protein Bsp3421_000100 [Burkholderia sp. FERM BP-3421]
MHPIRIKLAWIVVAAAVAGCASDRVAPPATTIDTEIKALTGEVSRFSDQAKDGRATVTADIVTFDQWRGSFDAATAMLQAQWTIAAHNGSTRTLAQLDSLAGAPMTTAPDTQLLATAASHASGAASGSAKPADPVASLSQIDLILQGLSKPGSEKAAFESGASFVVATGQAWQADKAKAASGAGAAPAPAASGAAAAANAKH